MVEINEAERKQEKRIKKLRTTLGTAGAMQNTPTFKSKESQKRRQKERP